MESLLCAGKKTRSLTLKLFLFIRKKKKKIAVNHEGVLINLMYLSSLTIIVALKGEIQSVGTYLDRSPVSKLRVEDKTLFFCKGKWVGFLVLLTLLANDSS